MDKEEIIKAYEAMCQAMIDRDIAYLRTLHQPYITHLSGMKQEREAWLRDIEEGNMVYHGYDIKDIVVSIDGTKAQMNSNTILEATIYGVKGKWTLPMQTDLIKTNGIWQIVAGSQRMIY